jgi:hypothetical protein
VAALRCIHLEARDVFAVGQLDLADLGHGFRIMIQLARVTLNAEMD